MARRTNTKLKEETVNLKIAEKPKKKADLKVAANPIKNCKPYNDIDLNNWKDYGNVLTDSLWLFPSRDKSDRHSNEYHGNYIPQLAEQFFERFTKKNDVVLDMFFGSGTSAIQALKMGRRCIGVELKPELVQHVSEKFASKELVTDVNIITGDSASEEIKDKVEARLEIMGKEKAQFVVLHPPYDDIITFSDRKEDLSNCSSPEEFYNLFEKVAKNAYDLLEDGRFAALIIGDEYKNSKCEFLSFFCEQRMEKTGFIPKAVIVKDIQGNNRAKGKTANLWRYRALFGGFYNFKHEYVFIFQKDEKLLKKFKKQSKQTVA